jgi:acyl carrier protein
MEAQGTVVVALQADVTHEEQIAAVLAQIDTSMPPLCGVFHAAGMLDDGLLLHLDAARFQPVMAPKVEGGWLLHRLTRHLALDLFVLYSSATAILGSPGQASYVAANAFLDALAHHRHSLGLPALAINWGAWAEVGMAAHGAQAENLARQGILAFAPQQGVQLLERILATSAVQVTAMAADWSQLHSRFPLPLLQELAAGSNGKAASTGHDNAAAVLRTQLRGLAPSERQAMLAGLLQAQLAQVLRMPGQKVDPHQPLAELGIDSLMTVELVNRIETALGLTVPVTVLLQGPTLARLAEHLLGLLDAAAPAPL